MAIAVRPWCDFVIYTTLGISVERIYFDKAYWDTLLPKLISFYDNCVAPKVVSHPSLVIYCEASVSHDRYTWLVLQCCEES